MKKNRCVYCIYGPKGPISTPSFPVVIGSFPSLVYVLLYTIYSPYNTWFKDCLGLRIHQRLFKRHSGNTYTGLAPTSVYAIDH